MKITDRGRLFVKDSGASRSEALREVVRHVPPYLAIVERVMHRREESIAATEVAAHWHEHFKSDVSDSEKILNDQAVCFFQIAQAADLGILTIGRKGKSTRFDFDNDTTGEFVDGTTASSQQHDEPTEASAGSDDMVSDDDGLVEEIGVNEDAINQECTEPVTNEAYGNRVFITHGENHKILEQVKEIVSYGSFEPVVAIEQETAAKPVPQKVMDDMRKCKAAVIHVSADRILYDEDRKEVRLINENVLIEIGAAMALYGGKFVLLVEEGVELPSNLQGLYECRYEGDELNNAATMKLLRAFRDFREGKT